MSKRYQVKPCDNGGSVTNAVRDRQWDVIDTATGATVANFDKRTDARKEAVELNANASNELARKQNVQALPDDDAREEAAKSRVHSAIEHLEEARAQIDAALADISSIVGASPNYQSITKLSNRLIHAYPVDTQRSES